jgi:tetratricopeptide (TPR) repeat protein
MSEMTLAAAIAVGASAFGLAWALRNKKGEPHAPAPSRVEELTASYQKVLEELRALDADKAQHTPEEYERERARLTREAVRLLKAADQAKGKKGHRPSAQPQTQPAAAAAAPVNPRDGWVGIAAGAGTVLVAGIIAMAVVTGQQERDEPPPRMMGQQQLPPNHPGDDGFAQALQYVQTHPEDLDAAAVVTRELIQRNQLDEAAELVEAALAIAPDHLASRIHKRVIEGAQGDLLRAYEELRIIAEESPAAKEALLYRGTLALRAQDRAVALESFERYAAEAPAQSQPPWVVHVLDMLHGRTMAGN